MDVRKLREEKGLSQQQLSELTGIPRGRINAWEQRGTMPKVADLETLKEFFNETNVPNSPEPISTSSHIEMLERVIKLLEDQVKVKDVTIEFQQRQIERCEEEKGNLKSRKAG